MRTWLARILVILVLLTAAVFGALNSSLVELDFLVSTWNLPLGVALLGFFVMGASVGLLAAYLALVPRLKREIHVLKKTQEKP